MSTFLLQTLGAGGGSRSPVPQGQASPSLFTAYRGEGGEGPLLGHVEEGAHTADGKVIMTSAYLKLCCAQNILLFLIQPS